MKGKIKIFEYLKADKISDLKENLNFYLAFGISFIIGLFITLHPSNLETLNELRNLKWIMIPAGIIGMTGLVLIGIFGYILLIIYSINSIKEKFKKKQVLSILGIVFQFFMIVAMTWPIPLITIRLIAKLYFNIIIPDIL